MKQVFEFYEIASESKSIYKYSPVHISYNQGQKVIIKKTKKHLDRMLKLFQWEELLVKSGIGVVAPITYKEKQYLEVDEENWVMYPFIEGRNYNGSKKDIFSAGQLLGRIHSQSSHGKHIFEHGFSWSNYDQEFFDDVAEDFKSISNNYPHMMDKAETKKLLNDLEELANTSFKKLQTANLPYVDGVWDYKANNLIYTLEGPILIDPDNSAYIPRVFDLALALILFHTEIQGIPARMFNVIEWNCFMDGYLEYVNLTSEEEAIWSKYLEFVFIDEALWAINDLEEDETERQKQFLESLLLFNADKYQLAKSL